MKSNKLLSLTLFIIVIFNVILFDTKQALANPVRLKNSGAIEQKKANKHVKKLIKELPDSTEIANMTVEELKQVVKQLVEIEKARLKQSKNKKEGKK